MQFLAIVNQQLRSDRQSFNRDLRARNYAVIPISRRSGLIQWVEGAIPLYSVFKQWQMRLKARQPGTLSARWLQPSVLVLIRVFTIRNYYTKAYRHVLCQASTSAQGARSVQHHVEKGMASGRPQKSLLAAS